MERRLSDIRLLRNLMLVAGGRHCGSVCVKWADDYDFMKENKRYLLRDQPYIIFPNYGLPTNKASVLVFM